MPARVFWDDIMFAVGAMVVHFRSFTSRSRAFLRSIFGRVYGFLCSLGFERFHFLMVLLVNWHSHSFELSANVCTYMHTHVQAKEQRHPVWKIA